MPNIKLGLDFKTFCLVSACFLHISRFFALSAEIIMFWLLKMRTNRATIIYQNM